MTRRVRKALRKQADWTHGALNAATTATGSVISALAAYKIAEMMGAGKAGQLGAAAVGATVGGYGGNRFGKYLNSLRAGSNATKAFDEMVTKAMTQRVNGEPKTPNAPSEAELLTLADKVLNNTDRTALKLSGEKQLAKLLAQGKVPIDDIANAIATSAALGGNEDVAATAFVNKVVPKVRPSVGEAATDMYNDLNWY